MQSSYYKRIIDSDWESATPDVGLGRVTFYRKRFPAGRDAKLFRDAHLAGVLEHSGALFVAYTAPVHAYTREESIEAVSRGHRDDWYVELFLVPGIRFEQLLWFLDYLEFGAGDDASPGRAEDRRSSAKRLLNWMHGLAPVTFTAVAQGHVSGRFLRQLSPSQFDSVLDRLFEYNRKYFYVQIQERYWRRAWETSNSFGLGAC